LHDVITNNLDLLTSALTTKSSTGRGSNGKREAYGIKKLRELILELAVRGKLVPQDPNAEPASVLLERIEKKKARLVKEGVLRQRPLPEITSDEVHFSLRNGWAWTRLGAVTNYGVTDKAEPKDVNEDTWVLELEDVEKETSKILQKSRFGKKPFLSSKNRFSSGDVIYGKLRPYLDKVLVADEDGVCTTEMVPVRGYMDIYPFYIRLVMKTPDFIKYANDSTHGMNLPRLGTDKARMALFPLPPYVEQQRIVAKVDELMALCDQLEQQQTHSIDAHQTLVETLLGTLTRVKSRQELNEAWYRIANHFGTLFTTEHSIDQLKQVILQLAIMGKLVPQDPNAEPASVLLVKIAREKERLIRKGKIKKQRRLPEISDDEKLFDLPSGWVWARLQDVIDVRDGTHDSPRYVLGPDTYPLVTSKNFSEGDIDFDGARRISSEDHREISKRSLVEKYDILFSMIGGNLGNQVMVKDDRPFSVKNVALFKYYSRELTSPFFIKRYMEHLALDLQEKAIGGAQPFVSLGFLRNLVFALPPTEEQQRIVAKVDELMALCNALKACLADAQTIQISLADAIVEQAVSQPR
jgi:type I restriction enzyme S subunit